MGSTAGLDDLPPSYSDYEGRGFQRRGIAVSGQAKSERLVWLQYEHVETRCDDDEDNILMELALGWPTW